MTANTFDAALFRGKVALVTGAASGIGAAIAKAFADLGSHVVMQDIDTGRLYGRAVELSRDEQRITAISGDLSVPGTAETVFDKALAAQGRVDFLINNAGRSWGVATDEITAERTSELMELNFNSVLWLSKRFIVHARERGEGGSIIQVSSTAGITGFQRRAVYCATKFGVIGLTKVLALDHARENIRVNAILPHVVETDMFRTVATPQDAATWRAGIPMGRFAQVEDVANLAIFLCSPAASYLTGGLYPVDGGAMAGSFGGE
ncbi:SDR family NAD(P)-dependent oxidoreductase [Sinorhizobium mexicanum]|uniref:SDR family oxidoreductase n=1 Tax=Sinorhizobium mexicanum TaxID=375549 RepID=A0A859QFK8_9HYPH|nr:SDR family oxidoreductase [Sinorhizobium mexicanum]MBP1886407.1 NAD(P)-dependent dehydrogenase (short-subunit alcohol dehydrogenase family) [Sinorhizobium mexicanum]QLL64002.1 SDR family oxidoreductase [Sinorhizobium mexicanum]